MMRHPGRIWKIALLLVTICASEPSHAWSWDWLSLNPTDIELFLRADGQFQRFDTGTNTRDYQWQTGVLIDQRGYIIDPDIAAFSLSLEPTYSWGKFKSNGKKQDNDGNYLSYILEANLLNGTPHPFRYNFFALRSSNTNTVALGGRYDSDVDDKRAAIFWKSRAFPMSLAFSDRYFEQTYLSSGDSSSTPTVRRDEHIQTLTLKGRSSKTQLFAEHIDMDNRLPDRDVDYILDRVTLDHVLPWGRDSRLNSRFNFYDRKGFNANRRVELDESARIQHTENVSSISHYEFSSISQTFDTTLNRADFAISHLLYRNLTTTAAAFGVAQRSDPQDLTRWNVRLSSRYNKDFNGVGVTAGFIYYYQETDRVTRDNFIEIVDESHVVPLGGAVVLNRRFVLVASIVVTNADGSLVYADGVDYTVFDLPEDLTQVQTIPGGRIETGDTILVSYKASALPSQKWSSTNLAYNLGFNLGWMEFSHSYSNLEENLISGMGESFLNPHLAVRTNLGFRWNLSKAELRLTANRRYDRYRTFENTIYTYRENLKWATSGTISWDLNVVQQFTESTSRNTDLYSLDLTMDWQARSNLSIRPRLGAWKRNDEFLQVVGQDKRKDLFITAGFSLRWWYRQVTFYMNYFHNQRTFDTIGVTSSKSDTTEDILWFNLTRKF